MRVGSHRPADCESPLDDPGPVDLARRTLDYTFQKAGELGVSRIVPIASERSVMRLSAERG